MQERRVLDRRQQPSARRLAILPYAILSAVLGLAGGFCLALVLDTGNVRLKESPFGGEAGRKVPRGRDFTGSKEINRWSDADQARYRKAMELARSGSAEALAELAPLRKAHPEYCLPHALAALATLGLLSGQAGDGDGAAAQSAFRACLSQDSAHPYAQYAAGRVLEAMGQQDSAEAHYVRALKAAPHFAYAYIGLGRVHLDEGDLRTANLNFRTAIALMESDPASYAPATIAIPVSEHEPIDLLATSFYQAGAEDSARMALEYGQEKNIKTDQMALVQGWLWESRGFLNKADSLYHALQAKDPGNRAFREAIATLGWKPQSRGQPGESKPADAEAIFAISLLDPLARQHTQNAPLWMALGQAYFRRGLYGIATECFDSSLKYDPVLPGLAEKRDAAYQGLIRQSVPAKTAARPSRAAIAAMGGDDQAPVVIPGSIALLGTYSVPWGGTATQVRQAYPKKEFHTLPNGNLLDVFTLEGIRHEYLLAFKQGHLWGVRAYVTDSAGVSGDLFGRIIRTKAKISGEGKGTGEAKCPGFHAFQGAIWENDDTFEFMAQFQGEEHRVRLARIGREYLPRDRRLCELVTYLKEDAWK